MIRRPPRSTLFPYTRSSDLRYLISVDRRDRSDSGSGETPAICAAASNRFRNGRPRSEEHTSELQSQSNLVCRLLLEKKKKKNYHITPACFLYRSQHALHGLP